MLRDLTSRLTPRRVALLGAVLGATLGSGGGVALALSGSFNHTYALWNHGFDGSHVYMSSTDGAGRNGSVGAEYVISGSGTHYPTGWTTDVASHIHNDYNNTSTIFYFGGRYQSSQTGLSAHEHDGNF